MTTINERDLPAPVIEKLKESLMRIKSFTAASWLWNKGLSDRDRQDLGGDLQTAHLQWGTVGMWRKLRGGSMGRAIVDVSTKLQLLHKEDRVWLLKELGETPKWTGKNKKPCWDSDCGELELEGQIIRTVKTFRTPSNIQRILDEFQHRRWRKKVRNPLEWQGQQQLHQALRSLNKGLQRIAFHSEYGGKSIRWSNR